MRRFLLLLSIACLWLSGAELASVHSVYLLPMSRALDQYLANRITNEHVFQVVTDPKKADAILTDRIGEGFEEKLATIVPSPEPVSPPPPASPPGESQAANTPLTETVNRLANPSLNSTFGRGRGTVFLVDPKSREVLWSVYEPAKSSNSTELDRTASDIVSRLKRALKPK